MAGDKEVGVANQFPREVVSDVSNVRFHATGLDREIYEAHRRPVRHNLTIERMALWHAVELDSACERSLQDGTPDWSAIVAGLDLEMRYEIRSAVAAIPHLVPFRASRARLRSLPGVTFEGWGEAMASREPEAVAEWHEWLWACGETKMGIADDFGGSSTLATAAARLSAGLLVVIEQIA